MHVKLIVFLCGLVWILPTLNCQPHGKLHGNVARKLSKHYLSHGLHQAQQKKDGLWERKVTQASQKIRERKKLPLVDESNQLSDMVSYSRCMATYGTDKARCASYAKPSKMLFFCSLLLFASCVHGEQKEDWPPTVHEGCPYSWSWDDSSKIFGVREKLPNDSMIGCDFRPNYTITCCASEPFRSISFDVGGIIGDQPEIFSQTDMANALAEIEKMCDARQSTHHISEEARILLKPKSLQNFNGTRCTVEIFEPDFAKFFGTIAYDLTLTRGSSSCPVRIWDVEKLNILPTLSKMITKLAHQFVLPRTPNTFIFDNEQCGLGFAESSEAMIIRGTVKKQKLEGILTSYNFLQQNSDDLIECTLGHEITHVAQGNHDKTGNEEEVEADIGSILVTQSPCVAMQFLEDDGMPAQIPTRENINEVLELQEEYDYAYPSHLARRMMIATINKSYEKARSLLLLTAEEK